MPTNLDYKYWDDNKVALCLSSSLDKIDKELMFSITNAIKPKKLIIQGANDNTKLEVLNTITDRAIRQQCDYLFFVDDDISFPSDTLYKLLMHDLDIVSGLYHLRYPPFSPIAGWVNGRGQVNGEKKIWNKYYCPLQKDKLITVHWVGSGCLLVKTDVFRKLGEPYFEDKIDKNGKRKIGHDIWFCNRARKAGYNIYVDTTIDCFHRASVMIGKDFAEQYNRKD